MYQVIVFSDESRNRNYYHSYYESDDTTVGNFTCDELPPYQDIHQAQACYWDDDNMQWVYDADKYSEIIEKIAAEKEAAKHEAAEAAATPTNEELAECMMELGEGQSNLEDAVAELGNLCASLEKRIIAFESTKNGGEE